MLASKKEIIEGLNGILGDYKEIEIVLPRSIPRKRKRALQLLAPLTRKKQTTYYWCEKGKGQMVECATGNSCPCNGWVRMIWRARGFACWTYGM
jgi:hypothetical protein